MKKSKSIQSTIREFEDVVNRLLESHDAAYTQWEKVRLKRLEIKPKSLSVKRQSVEANRDLLNA